MSWPVYPEERERWGCVGCTAGLESCRKCCPHRDLIPSPSSLWQVAIPTALCPLSGYVDSEWHRVKRKKNQQDATSISTCFGHQYVHLQEDKTVHYRIWCSALVVPTHSSHSSQPNSTQPQPAQPVQNTNCGSTQSCSPEDGHNGAWNMLT